MKTRLWVFLARLDELVIVDGGHVTEPIRVDIIRVEKSGRGSAYLDRLVGCWVESEEGIGLRQYANKAIARTNYMNPRRMKALEGLLEREIDIDSDDAVFARSFVVDGVEGVA